MEGGLSPDREGRRGLWAVGGLALILAVTGAWWAFALWPLPAAAPTWVARARATCFGVEPGGLPHTGGWLLLVGEPLGMVAILLTVWGDAVAAGLRELARRPAGRVLLALATGMIAGAGHLAGQRISSLRGEPFPTDGARLDDVAVERVDRVAPPLRLVDQRGDTVTLDRFRGGPVLLTFAYGHCRSVCPLTVRRMLDAQRRVPGGVEVLVVTLDPWRDTPERLEHIAGRWGFDGNARVLGGSVEAVTAVLEQWQVPNGRDPRTGEIAHAPTVYAIGRDGRIAYRAAGLGEEGMIELLGRL
jgi:protein SCO1/2